MKKYLGEVLSGNRGRDGLQEPLQITQRLHDRLAGGYGDRFGRLIGPGPVFRLPVRVALERRRLAGRDVALSSTKLLGFLILVGPTRSRRVVKSIFSAASRDLQSRSQHISKISENPKSGPPNART